MTGQDARTGRPAYFRDMAHGLHSAAALVLLLTCALPGSSYEGPSTAEMVRAAQEVNQVYQRHLWTLFTQLEEGDRDERLRAMEHLGRLGDERAVPHLMPFLDKDVHPVPVVEGAIAALSMLGSQRAAAALRELAALDREEHEEIRIAAVAGLSVMESMGLADYELQADQENDTLRRTAVTGIGLLEDGGPAEVLVEALHNDSRPLIRRIAAASLGRMGNDAYGDDLAKALTDSDAIVRRHAAEGLAMLDHQEALPELLLALEGNIASRHIDNAIVRLTGQDFGYDPHAPKVDRDLAIDKAFTWLTLRDRE